jgi:hypothetical protein
MNFYEYFPHEYSYALYLAYEFDLNPYDSMISNNTYQDATISNSYFKKHLGQKHIKGVCFNDEKKNIN